ncbi:putative wH2 motif domain protein [Trichonephila clavata]|uniref:Putative wH2 motif domain protein n=1 Tax=Trichonephila clavata TaxID=2740835 RepID=A0A8X6EY03_TRICU|nr:putative wH2 motif domain protein [Trichonephila clavata]
MTGEEGYWDDSGSFTSGQYLPYVIAAVSGSGAIAAVPLAIFTVSTAVALISTIYLIRLAVSRADNKKEEPQKFVCESCTNLGNKSSVPTPTPPPVTLGTQPNPSVSVPPPPPPPFPQDAALPPPPPHFFTASKRTEQPKNDAPKKAGEPENNNHSTLFEQIRGGTALKRVSSNKSGQQQNFTNELEAKSKSSGGTDKEETPEEYAARIEKVREESKQRTMRNAQGRFPDMASILARRGAMEPSSSESEGSDHGDSGDWGNDESKKPKEKKLTKHRKKPTPSNSQPEDERGSKSPGSGHGSDDNVKPKSTPPPHSVLKAKPPLSPKPADLQTKSPATKVTNEAEKPSAPSFKDRYGMFGEAATKFKRGIGISTLRKVPHTSLLFQNKFTYRSDCIKIV